MSARFPTLTAPSADIADIPRMEKVNAWLTRAGKQDREERGQIANLLKDSLFNNLDKKSILKDYRAVIEAIAATIDELGN